MQSHEILFPPPKDLLSSQESGRSSLSTNGNSHDSTDEINSTTKPEPLEANHKIKFQDWGFKVDRLFEVAYRFYKRNENKAFHLSYDERNRMIALIMQAKFGDFVSGKAPDVGVLDLVGKRRQHEWMLLKGMSKTYAMTEFICALDDICPIFKVHAEAIKISSGFENNESDSSSIFNGQIDNGTSSNLSRLVYQESTSGTSERSAQLQSIYSSLCRQTYNQFKKYAEKQHPGDVSKQKPLIISLQEQYYNCYVSQMHPDLKGTNLGQPSNLVSNIPFPTPSPETAFKSDQVVKELDVNNDEIAQSNAVQTNNEVIEEESTKPSSFSDESSKIDLNSGSTKKVDENSQFTSEALRVAHLADEKDKSDINCEDDVQADVSRDELNSEPQTNLNDLLKGNNYVNKLPTHSTMTTTKLDTKSLSSQMDPQKRQQQLHREYQDTVFKPVKFNQSIELPPIGTFESFPEPKLVRVTNQLDSINSIDPNLPPNKPLDKQQQAEWQKCTELDKKDTIWKASDQDVADLKQNTSSCTTATYNTQYDDNNPSVQILPPVPYEYDETFLIANDPMSQPTMYEPSSHTTVKPNNSSTSDMYSIKIRAAEDPTLKQDHVGTATNQPHVLWDPASSSGGCSPELQVQPYEPLEPATIWTKQAVTEFKDSLEGDKQGGIYEIKEGALVVIQVPTYPGGKYIYFEFATDSYDIGFGLDFLCEMNLTQPLALHIYEDENEDELDDDIFNDCLSETNHYHHHVEAGDSERCTQAASSSADANERVRMVAERRRRLANTVPIVSTYRRDSHEEVFVGRHKYPGSGYYLLKFDNTYSVLRSKTLYFRICYFM